MAQTRVGLRRLVGRHHVRQPYQTFCVVLNKNSALIVLTPIDIGFLYKITSIFSGRVVAF